MNKKTFIGFSITVCLLSLAWICLTPIFLTNHSPGGKTPAPHEGFYAPGFSLETSQGRTVNLSDYQGHPVLIFLWASWCSVCKATMPGLQSVYEDYAKDGFEILAVHLTYQDALTTAQPYFESQGYTFTMLLDKDGAVAKNYQIHALPTSVLVAPDGIIMDVIIGSGMSEGFLRSRLNDIVQSERQ
jgi:peroxiredoxin